MKGKWGDHNDRNWPEFNPPRDHVWVRGGGNRGFMFHNNKQAVIELRIRAIINLDDFFLSSFSLLQWKVICCSWRGTFCYDPLCTAGLLLLLLLNYFDSLLLLLVDLLFEPGEYKPSQMPVGTNKETAKRLEVLVLPFLLNKQMQSRALRILLSLSFSHDVNMIITWISLCLTVGITFSSFGPALSSLTKVGLSRRSLSSSSSSFWRCY